MRELVQRFLTRLSVKVNAVEIFYEYGIAL